LAGCAIAVTGTGEVTSVTLTVPCGAAVVNVGVALIESDIDLVNASAGGFGIGVSATLCGVGEALSFAGLIADIRAAVHDTFKRAEEEIEKR